MLERPGLSGIDLDVQGFLCLTTLLSKFQNIAKMIYIFGLQMFLYLGWVFPQSAQSRNFPPSHAQRFPSWMTPVPVRLTADANRGISHCTGER